ncbi:MAG: DUF86 domain-containing protein [Thermoleophilaceae bacterium]|nr:DUF86 domain-containing protein [Thermoleophilaceae bacterium]
MTRSDAERVEISLEHIRILNSHMARKGTVDDDLLFDAVCMQLSSAIESANGISPDRREALFGSDWPLIKAMRNSIAHDYAFVDSAMVGESVELEVPKFRASLLELQAQLQSG